MLSKSVRARGVSQCHDQTTFHFEGRKRIFEIENFSFVALAYATCSDITPDPFKKMIDELREEAIIQKVGGRFKLSTLIQKRLIALNHGAKPLVILPRASNLEIVIQEILRDKIFLSMKNELKTIEDDFPTDIPQEVDMASL